MRDRTNHRRRYLDRGRGFKSGGKHSFTDGKRGHASWKQSTRTIAGIPSTAATPENRRHKTSSKENKQFDPGGKEKKAPP